jgi:hypothetical protein
MSVRKKLAGLFGGPRVDERPRSIPIVIDRSRQQPVVKPAGYLWAAAIIRDEGPYLAEWITFHHAIGVERFILYDNGSVDDTPAVLAPFIRAGLVEVIPWPNFLAGANAQHLAYAHAARHAAGRCRWLAVIDADEFLFPPQATHLPPILRDYEDLPALAVFLRTFGASGHQRRPDGLVIENYVHRLPDTVWENRQYKSIVQPHLMRSVISAQRFHNLDDNLPAHDENRRPLTFAVSHAHVSERLRINHYATKSTEEMAAKVARRYFWSAGNDGKRRRQKADQHGNAAVADILDTEIHRFLPSLRAALAAPAAGTTVTAIRGEAPRPVSAGAPPAAPRKVSGGLQAAGLRSG